MKCAILFLFSIALIATGCRKTVIIAAPAAVLPLNDTENKLLGIWYLTKFVDSNDYNSYTSGYGDTTITYIVKDMRHIEIFTKAQYAGTTDKEKLSTANFGQGSYYLATVDTISSPGKYPWYYDTAYQYLYIGGYNYSIITLTDNQLILFGPYYGGSTGTDYWYFKR